MCSKGMWFSPNKAHVFSQTENAFCVDSGQYMIHVLLLCYHTVRLSSLCKIVCHKAKNLCMKKDNINALVEQLQTTSLWPDVKQLCLRWKQVL